MVSIPRPIPLEERRELVDTKGVTLNGKPAVITGAGLDFAVVIDMKTGLGAEWAWETVRRIVDKGGAFKS